MKDREMTKEEEEAIQMSWQDAIHLSYLRGDMSEGGAAYWLEVDRLTFRTNLSDWLKNLMDNAPVPVEGWQPARTEG